MTLDVAAELARLEHELRTQDNRITHAPIFMVQEKRRLCGIDPTYDVEVVWLHSDCEVTAESDPEEFARLEGPYQERGHEDEDWTRTGYIEQWHNVQPFFTEQAANAYLKLNGHNLKETRIYVESGYRNAEWIALRAMLGSGELVRAVQAREFLQRHGEPLLRLLNAQGDGSAFESLLALLPPASP